MENNPYFLTHCFSHFISLHKIIVEDKSGEENDPVGTYPEGDGPRGFLWWIVVQPVPQRCQNTFPVANQIDF